MMKFIVMLLSAYLMTYLIIGFNEKYGFAAAVGFFVLTSVVTDFAQQRTKP